MTKIIAMSLYGTGKVYLQGAIANAILLPQIYPEWILRIYYSSCEVDAVELKGLGCDMVWGGIGFLM